MLARVLFWLARVVVFARVVKYFLARESLSCLRGLFYSLPLCGLLACLGLSSVSAGLVFVCVVCAGRSLGCLHKPLSSWCGLVLLLALAQVAAVVLSSGSFSLQPQKRTLG